MRSSAVSDSPDSPFGAGAIVVVVDEVVVAGALVVVRGWRVVDELELDVDEDVAGEDVVD
jgi:hypothetical protein